ncbi:MAG: hypothetical protein COC06_11070 [Bacteroidales bacterium]|nr:MAG: hypothetical protein COC06_11070 [Bacteroidales bacterium]
MDKSHFNTFIFSSADKIYYYVYCLVKNQKDAVELVSLTIEECWKERKKFSHTDMVYVFRIARKLAKLKIAGIEKRIPPNYTNNLISDTNPVLLRFCALTQDLSPVQAEVMCLRSMVRLRMDDISIIIDLGINNVQSILSVVRKVIRAGIDPNGILSDFKSNEVLSKYYSGKSTIEEEEQLRLYFLRMDLSDITRADKELFQLFLKMSNAPMPTDCSDKLLLKIKEIQNTTWRTSFSRIFKK